MTAEHTPPTAAEVALDVLMKDWDAWAERGQWASPASRDRRRSRVARGHRAMIAKLAAAGLLRPDTPPPSAPNTIEWWRDLANNNQRQLDIVDEALGWQENGGGRIACVEELKRLAGLLRPDTPPPASEIARIIRDYYPGHPAEEVADMIRGLVAGSDDSTDTLTLAFIEAFRELRSAWDAMPEVRKLGSNDVMVLGKAISRCKEAQKQVEVTWAALASQPKGT